MDKGKEEAHTNDHSHNLIPKIVTVLYCMGFFYSFILQIFRNIKRKKKQFIRTNEGIRSQIYWLMAKKTFSMIMKKSREKAIERK